MRGLRTQENDKFLEYWKRVQEAAEMEGAVFFLESGDGRDFCRDDIEGEDLGGWLVPIEHADEFELLWQNDAHKDYEETFPHAEYAFAEWEDVDGEIIIEFHKYD